MTRVKFYTGTVYVMRLSRPLDPAREQRLKATADQLHSVGYPYPTMQQAFGAALLGRKVPARHCFQHVAHLLDEARLTPLGLDAPSPIQASFRCAAMFAACQGAPSPTATATTPYCAHV